MPESLQEFYEYEAYRKGYEDAKQEIREKEKRAREKRARRIHELKYFAVQKAAGFIFVAGSISLLPQMDYDGTYLFLTVPMGLAMLFSKQHLLQIMGHTGLDT